MKNIDRDILRNSEYIITYFNKNNKDVTNLMLQKLLYFLEAIYMVIEDEDYLFEEEFFAWDFGPVNDVIYKHYKLSGIIPIELDKGITINSTNLKYIENLYELFKDYSAFDLVGLAHMEDSPWDKINNEYGGKIPKNVIINKIKTKEWFQGIASFDYETN